MLAPILAFAGVAAVQAGPLYQRQVSSAVSSAVGSAISSAVGAPSSIASDVSSAVASATSSASSAVESATSAASSGVASASSAVSSASSSGASAAISAAPSNTTTGNQSYPLYPCPTGYLLTYVQVNQTVPVPVTQVTQQFGEWANSSYFPNVTASEGGNNVGATHTINLQGVDLIETLVNATMFNNSGAARWEWNLTNGPASAMGVSISNYSTVLSIYDPTFESTNTIGNETTLLTYTNFCASSQAEGMTLVSALANLELGSFAGRLGGSAAGGMSSMSMSMDMTSSMASSMASSAMMATSSAASSAMMATSSIASSAAEATSSAASAAASGASAASSGAAGATSTIAGAVSSAITAVLPSSSA